MTDESRINESTDPPLFPTADEKIAKAEKYINIAEKLIKEELSPDKKKQITEALKKSIATKTAAQEQKTAEGKILTADTEIAEAEKIISEKNKELEKAKGEKGEKDYRRINTIGIAINKQEEIKKTGNDKKLKAMMEKSRALQNQSTAAQGTSNANNAELEHSQTKNALKKIQEEKQREQTNIVKERIRNMDPGNQRTIEIQNEIEQNYVKAFPLAEEIKEKLKNKNLSPQRREKLMEAKEKAEKAIHYYEKAKDIIDYGKNMPPNTEAIRKDHLEIANSAKGKGSTLIEEVDKLMSAQNDIKNNESLLKKLANQLKKSPHKNPQEKLTSPPSQLDADLAAVKNEIKKKDEPNELIKLYTERQDKKTTNDAEKIKIRRQNAQKNMTVDNLKTSPPVVGIGMSAFKHATTPTTPQKENNNKIGVNRPK